MAWQETCVMDERLCFVSACLEGGDSISELCRVFGISRKTGHKWLGRYRRDGVRGLEDRSRAPHGNPRAVGAEIRQAVLDVRRGHPRWGPRKVKAWLEARSPDLCWPAASTIGDMLVEAGLSRARKRCRRIGPQSYPFQSCRAPNDVWCMDFKGWFLTGDGIQVDPLTVTDAESRYLIRCEAVGRPDLAHVWPVLESAFYEFGLPTAMRSDNGAPFAGRGAGGLSRLAVRLIKAGIRPERIEPGKPQQNGRHERMHLTLQEETASPPARSLKEQMQRFRDFRQSFNHERPHEALDYEVPAARYQPSPRRFDGRLRSPDYPHDAEIRRVRRTGEIKWRNRNLFLTEVLSGEPVGLFLIGPETWLVKYGPVALGSIRGKAGFEKFGVGSRSRTKPRPEPG
ncbi:IS481 family transposase [Tistrella mobilis]|uniref:integrase core domain-containing protein n=1 Tax=Tistrella mobilis TaxID=171437 RepID=UPI003557566B